MSRGCGHPTRLRSSDPSELAVRFLEHWQEGADVVYGIRVQRTESWAINFARFAFYRFVDMLSEDKIPVDVGDFRLISRRIIDLLCVYEEVQPYLRGTIATMGFKQIGIEYARAARKRGESKFPISKMIALAIDGILNHSTVPLRFSTYFGLTISLVTLIMMSGICNCQVSIGFELACRFYYPCRAHSVVNEYQRYAARYSRRVSWQSIPSTQKGTSYNNRAEHRPASLAESLSEIEPGCLLNRNTRMEAHGRTSLSRRCFGQGSKDSISSNYPSVSNFAVST